jgi:gliotoxin/aspirochlorine biosynthesis aminotransferase
MGDPKLLLALTSLFNDYFQPHVPVMASHVITGAGAGAVLDSLVFNICNPGDGLLVLAPYWGKLSIFLARVHSRGVIRIITD